jgi:ABC-type glutathione transport system ATPase component
MKATRPRLEKRTEPGPALAKNEYEDGIRRRLEHLEWQLQEKMRRQHSIARRVEELNRYLEISNQVTDALQTLSEKLFKQVLGLLEQKLTIALQEVLGQPIKFRARSGFKKGGAVVEFAIERDGHEEEVYRGQGGSVQNVLSVGLRMFALATLDPAKHRRFLVLDEQDCWLRPELVPELVKIVHQAARKLGFQVIMISHHDYSLFDRYADRIYRFVWRGDSVQVEHVHVEPNECD